MPKAIVTPKPLTAKRLRELVAYDPKTGLFTCIAPRIGRRVGDIERRIAGPGYIAFCIDGRQYTAHRLAWLYMHGELPPAEIDHINGQRTDNRLSNLRLADRIQNAANVKTHRDNKSGLKGVFPMRRRWSAQIKVRGITHHLGTFDTPAEAHAAYIKAARRLRDKLARTK